jgi:hypothetical protein
MGKMREFWKSAKASAEKAGLKLSEYAQDTDFGPNLDKFETAALKAYENQDPDKENALKKAALLALNVAQKSGIKYAKDLEYLMKNRDEPELGQVAQQLWSKGLQQIMAQLAGWQKRLEQVSS